MNYQDYLIEDFVLDENFRQWAKNPTLEQNLFWNKWILENPEKREIIENAKKIVLSLSLDKDDPFSEELTELWKKIEQTNSENDLIINIRSSNKIFSNWHKIAAVFAGFLLVASIIIIGLNAANTVYYSTNYGEIKNITLPDGSQVALNTNSSINYSYDLDKASIREVWLKGEAFFSVIHKRNRQKFIVHAADLQIEVLGTKFNVNARQGKTKVVLNSGSVKLDIHNAAKESIYMKPGELVEFSQQDKKIIKKNIEPDHYTSWRKNRLIFEEVTLAEIAQLLQDNYGLRTSFADQELSKLTFTGSVNADNPKMFLTILEKTFHVKIIRNENKLIVKK